MLEASVRSRVQVQVYKQEQEHSGGRDRQGLCEHHLLLRALTAAMGC